MNDITANNHRYNRESVEAHSTTPDSYRAYLREEFYQYVKKQGVSGSTCDEAAIKLGVPHQTASARFTELKRDGRIIPTEARRPTVLGKPARVLIADVHANRKRVKTISPLLPIAIDFETYSPVDLKRCGLDVYATDPSTGVHCLAWGTDPFEVNLWKEGEPFPDELRDHIERGGTFTAWNASFEWSIWNKCAVKKYGWPALPIEQLECSMAAAYAMSLPGALEKAAIATNVDQQKDAAGARIMLQLAKPKLKDSTLWRPADNPEKFSRLYSYCQQDVRTELAIREKIMALPPSETALWRLDHKINQRGVRVDLESISKAIKIVEAEKKRLDTEMLRVTRGSVGKCSEVQLLVNWIRLQGVKIEGLAKSEVLDALSGELPDNVRAALALRKEAAKTSTSKLIAMQSRASADGRVRNTMQFHGASTGRWAGRGVQVQNFPRNRPATKQHHIDDMFEHLTDRDYLDVFYGPVLDAVSDCLRGMIIASPLHDLIAMDFSAIEARVLAWLAGQESVLDVFRDHGKIYEHAASGIYDKPIADVTKDERQIGKVAVLALGYGGGVGAFQSMARIYGVKVEDKRADEIKVAWRQAHPKIVRYWYALETAAINALDFGEVTSAGAPGREVKFVVKGSFLFCRLPSGRILSYPYPSMKNVTTPWGETKMALHAYAIDGTTSKWGEYSIWGGFLSENITQAVSRDLLAEAMPRLEHCGFPIIFHAHDEVVCEVPETAPPEAEHEVARLLSIVPEWASGLPIAAEGWRAKRYRK